MIIDRDFIGHRICRTPGSIPHAEIIPFQGESPLRTAPIAIIGHLEGDSQGFAYPFQLKQAPHEVLIRSHDPDARGVKMGLRKSWDIEPMLALDLVFRLFRCQIDTAQIDGDVGITVRQILRVEMQVSGKFPEVSLYRCTHLGPREGNLSRTDRLGAGLRHKNK